MDHLSNYVSFTYDKLNYSALPNHVEDLHQKGIKFIIVLVFIISSHLTVIYLDLPY
jgi:hypothetical protein